MGARAQINGLRSSQAIGWIQPCGSGARPRWIALS
jgi:hypothetical protein